MARISLSRLPGDRVLAVDGGLERDVALGDLPAFVRGREVDGPRWVWDDTARWYPPLLAVGVRVERCHDLRLGHHLLRGLRRPTRGCSRGAVRALGPARAHHGVASDAVLDRRHGRAPARRPRGRPPAGGRGRLPPGLPARAAPRGGVVGRAGGGRDDVRRCAVARRRPRAPAHRAPRSAPATWRPAPAARGAGGRGAPRVRRPGPQPGLASRAAGGAAPGRGGRPGHPRLDAAGGRPRGGRAAAALQAARAPVPDQRLDLARPVGARRQVPSVVPAGRLGDRPVVVQRRRGVVVPGAGALRGRGRRRVGVRGGRRRPARATGARRHERRPGAGPDGTGSRPLPGDGRGRRCRQAVRTPSSACSARCTAPPVARAAAWSPG